MNEDEWFRERSSLNHTDLGHKIRRILTTDNEIYIKYAISGKSGEAFSSSEEQSYYEKIRQSIDAWSSVKDMMIKHADKVFDEFKPYSQALRLLSSYLPSDVIEWLRSIIDIDIINRFQLKEWVNTVNIAVKKVDDEFKSFDNVTALREAVIKLQDVYSERSFIK